MNLPKNFPVIRQSNLDQARCPFRFEQIQLRGKKEPPSEYAGRGTQFHQLHKQYIDWLVRSSQEYDFDYAERLVVSAIGIEAAALWRSWFPRQIFNPSTIYGTEVKLCLDADFNPCPVGGHAFSSEFDRLQIDGDEAEIWDAKTHWAPYDPEDTIQCLMYVWILFKTMPHLKKVKFTLSFVRWHIERSAEFEAIDVPRIENEVLLPMVYRIISAFEANEWPAIPCKSCSYCSLECPLLEEGIRGSQFGRFADPKKAAETLYVMQSRGKILHDQLRAWAIENGPIDMADGLRLGFNKVTTQEYQVRDAVRMNEELGFDPYRALKVENAEVKRIGKGYPHYVAELEKTKEDSSTAVFEFRRIKP